MQNDSIQTAKAKINAWTKEAIVLQEEYERACGYAARHHANFDGAKEDLDRTEAIKWYGKAWKASQRLAALKQNVAWEASLLSKVYQHEQNCEASKSLDEAHSLRADAEYFATMSQQANAERDTYLAYKHDVLGRIKALRAKKSQAVTA